MQDIAVVQCPFCFESVEIYLEPDVSGTMVQDCEVCCRPWQMRVSHDAEGDVFVDVTRG